MTAKIEQELRAGIEGLRAALAREVASRQSMSDRLSEWVASAKAWEGAHQQLCDAIAKGAAK